MREDLLCDGRPLSREFFCSWSGGKDSDLPGHREWVERVCGAAGVEAFEPLWGGERRVLLDEFIEAGFVARIVAVREDALGESFLGRRIDRGLVAELEARGIDASGENGEYHTVVTDGPLFARVLQVEERGRVVRGGCRVLDLGIAV